MKSLTSIVRRCEAAKRASVAKYMGSLLSAPAVSCAPSSSKIRVMSSGFQNVGSGFVFTKSRNSSVRSCTVMSPAWQLPKPHTGVVRMASLYAWLVAANDRAITGCVRNARSSWRSHHPLSQRIRVRSPVDPLVSTSSISPDVSSAFASRPGGTHCLGSVGRMSCLNRSGSLASASGRRVPGWGAGQRAAFLE